MHPCAKGRRCQALRADSTVERGRFEGDQIGPRITGGRRPFFYAIRKGSWSGCQEDVRKKEEGCVLIPKRKKQLNLATGGM